MNIFSKKIKMLETIQERDKLIKNLEQNLSNCQNDILNLQTELESYKKENCAYEKKYVNTNMECQFCYTTLQSDFLYCPRCGKAVVKNDFEQSYKKSPAELFEIELDGQYVLITQYNGFNDKRIVIPSKINGKRVIGIWNNVFSKCTELEEVVFEEGCQYICNGVFSSCSNLKRVKLPKSLIEIGNHAFSGAGIEEIAVPPNVKIIGKYAFAHSKIKQIILPQSLRVISYGMFWNTPIEKIDIPQSVRHIDSSAFRGTQLKEVELPDNLYSIGSEAFACSSLERIVLHSNIEIFDGKIFEDGKAKANPMVYCASGSKALLYVRKFGYKCEQIPSKPPVNEGICVSSIIFAIKRDAGKRVPFADFYKILGIHKVETWSWEITAWYQLDINKYMQREEAMQLRDKIQDYIDEQNKYAKYPIERLNCELCICEHWGMPQV